MARRQRKADPADLHLKRSNVVIEPMLMEDARRLGGICASADSSDIVDASVVVATHKYGYNKVMTSDPDDIAKLDSKLTLIVI